LPKALASVGDMPFLELLVRQLKSQGIRRLIMCTGHLADKIEKQFGDGRHLGVEIRYSQERQPLGTAGAVKLAGPDLGDSQDFLVMNGDSFLEIDFQRLIAFQGTHRGVMSMAVVRVANVQRYGTVQVQDGGQVTSFTEKTGVDTDGLVNAGIYVFDRRVLEEIPEGKASLEHDVFPRLLERGVFALEQHGMFIDIGTPEDYLHAQAIADRLCETACKDK
jgi:D-glycero-alpha-D-manno-heptose 1-phosphate guanylyltransferase